jgi:hypothetical protein
MASFRVPAAVIYRVALDKALARGTPVPLTRRFFRILPAGLIRAGLAACRSFWF